MKLRTLLLALVAAFAVGCGPRLPDNARFQGEALSGSIDRASDSVKALERDHQNSLANPALAVIGPYAERAGFAAAFARAKAHVAKAREIQTSRVAEHLKSNRPENEPPLLAAVEEAKRELQAARAETDRIARTRTALLKAASDLPSFAATAQTLTREADAIEARLAPAVQESKRRHPAKAADLDRRLQAIRAIGEDTGQQRKIIEAESAKPRPDLLAVVQAEEKARANSVKMTADATDLETRMRDLDLTVTRRLEDMRLDYAVTFGRSSWDESSDSDREQIYHFFPVNVPLSMAQDLSKLGGETIDASWLSRAGVDPGQNQEWGHNNAEYWIEDVDERPYHRYLETVNGQSKLTEWMPVSDEIFERHEKDLGMEIFVKPYGFYADEAYTTAAPPGMALVGNPRYGTWRDGAWHWLPNYLFYSNLYAGNYHYRRDEWESWSRSFRGRRPYYGRGDREEEREYGTNGRYSRVYYGNSHWARSTGFRSYDVSFRGLGPEYRGGGPGGGGK